ncbi:MAG: tRNA dihydrouridine(20/20a) synthase DusA [Gammaproteobacteria bacterium]|nr:MAG: tRNA dihydrouridine(20/20a) synthase DusA [Gammaproteobacteria bacterium]
MNNPDLNRRFSVAPMLDWTNRHCRYFHRLLTKNTLLYTEMVTTGALIHGHRERFLRFHETEHPLAIQLGGSSPKDLATCAHICEEQGFDEINLNVGCPSDRVQSGSFGACLMAEPDLVAKCTRAMIEACSVPITVKCRIGIDDQDEYRDLQNFVTQVADSGVTTFIVHARKAWLQGLSPKENRDIPPLNYQRVYQLKEEFPQLEIIINGGITSIEDSLMHLQKVDGVMIGREAYQNPFMLAQIDQQLFGSTAPVATREQIIAGLIPYIDEELANGGKLNYITRHILGLYQNVPGARKWRRYISENAHKPDACSQLLLQAQEFVHSPSGVETTRG